MSYCYKGIAKKCTCPANEFLLHACMHADRRKYIYTPADKRYSPIITTICGPNNQIGLFTDASLTLGLLFNKKHNDEWVPLGFYSKGFHEKA